ncbi:MAG: hypothetical protein WC732_06630 [Candidatus Omnitrophota bacterium]
MEIIIGVLLVGFLGLVAMILKTSSEDAKKSKVVEDAKGRRISDLEAQLLQKDGELKKVMEERQKLEDEFFKAKDDAEIFKRENTELLQKLKTLEKQKEETGPLREELKQKEAIAHQETVARQKMEGELSLRETEIEKTQKERDSLKADLKAKSDLYEGLKGQYDELEAEVQKLREAQIKIKAETPKAEPANKPVQAPEASELPKPEIPKAEPPKAESPKAEPPKPELPKAESLLPEAPKAGLPEGQAFPGESAKPETPKNDPAPKPGPFSLRDAGPKGPQAAEPRAQQPKPSGNTADEIPGFPKADQTKVDIKKDVPGDVEFFKVQPKKEDEASGETEAPFKLTNVNKPSAPAAQPSEKKDAAAGSQQKPPEKSKTKRETLIPGFQPKEDKPE